MSAAQHTINRRNIVAIAALVLVVAALSRLDRAAAFTSGPPPGEGLVVVFVASGANFPDALSIGPIAAMFGVPIILVPVNPPLDGFTVSELERLDPGAVVIVGGTSAVSQATEDAIQAILPLASIERVNGANRYQTNAMLSAIYPLASTVSIPAPAFTAVNPDSNVAEIGPNIAHSSSLLYAPVDLPHGARIVGLTLAGADSDGLDGVGIRLQRTTHSSIETLAEVFSGDSYNIGAFAFTTNDITGDLVDNNTYGYIIEVYTSQSDRFVSNVMVRYEFGPPAG